MKKLLVNAAMLAVAVSLGAPAAAEMKGMDMKAQGESQQRAEATGEVNNVIPDKNKVVLTHDPIPALGWPAMKMGFETAESISLEALQPGDAVRFVIESRGGKNKIVEIERLQ
ncbi:MAG: hypothetical protein CMH11_00685 [Maritimibacter sp.]|nr:hypothetical protein [Maritimibacter sp.]|tara:strand:+ start:1662 stop:2000 length:339 start_codon:yes stop_codon:yes gene_type:complete